MRPDYVRREFPGSNPVANLIVVVVGVLVAVAAIVLGFFAFVALSALLLVVAAVVGVRVWWLRRQFRRDSVQSTKGRPAEGARGVIEGEYRVLGEDRDEA